MHYYFIAYDYDTNAVIPKPITDLKDETIIKAFEEVFNELKEKGIQTDLKCDRQSSN